jgi:hypothetical protein
VLPSSEKCASPYQARHIQCRHAASSATCRRTPNHTTPRLPRFRLDPCSLRPRATREGDRWLETAGNNRFSANPCLCTAWPTTARTCRDAVLIGLDWTGEMLVKRHDLTGCSIFHHRLTHSSLANGGGAVCIAPVCPRAWLTASSLGLTPSLEPSGVVHAAVTCLMPNSQPLD